VVGTDPWRRSTKRPIIGRRRLCYSAAAVRLLPACSRAALVRQRSQHPRSGPANRLRAVESRLTPENDSARAEATDEHNGRGVARVSRPRRRCGPSTMG
jgi:hypothetical protein